MTHSSYPETDLRLSQLDNQIEATEQKIQALLKELQELRRERNELAPVHRLPIDVLARVFNLTESTQWLWTPWLILLTSVCHHWRSAISNYPMLWTIVVYKHNGQLKLALKRSGNALISLELHGDSDEGRYLKPQTNELIRPHLHRIKELKVSAKFFGMVNFPFFDEGVELPALRALKSSGMGLRRLDISTWASHLVTFKSFRDSFDWLGPPILPSSLVRLAIISPSRSIPVSQLIRTLESLPKLSYLETKNCLGDSGNEGSGDPRPAPLQVLQRFSTEERFEQTLALLSRITLPAHTNINVAVHCAYVADAHACILTAIGAAQERNHSSYTLCKFPIELSLTHTGVVSATFEDAIVEDVHGDRREQQVSWNIVTLPVNLKPSAISSHWDFSRLTSLKIDGHRTWMERTRRYGNWIQSFGNLPDLRILELDESASLFLRLYIMEEKSRIWCDLSGPYGDLFGVDLPLLNSNKMQAFNGPMYSQYATAEAERRLDAEETARTMGLKFCALRKLSVVSPQDRGHSWETVSALWDLADFLSLRENLGVGIEKLVYRGAEDWMQSQLKEYVRSVFV